MIKRSQNKYSIDWNVGWAEWVEYHRSYNDSDITVQCYNCRKEKEIYNSLPQGWFTMPTSHRSRIHGHGLFILCSEPCREAQKFRRLLK